MLTSMHKHKFHAALQMWTSVQATRASMKVPVWSWELERVTSVTALYVGV